MVMSCKSRTILEIFWISAGFSPTQFCCYPFAQPTEHYTDRLIYKQSLIYAKFDKSIIPAANGEEFYSIPFLSIVLIIVLMCLALLCPNILRSCYSSKKVYLWNSSKLMKTVILTSRLTNWTLRNPVLQYPFNTASTRNSITSVDTGLSWTTMVFPWDFSVHQPQSPSHHLLSLATEGKGSPALAPTLAEDNCHNQTSWFRASACPHRSEEGISSNMKSLLKHLAGKYSSCANITPHHQIHKWERAIPAKVNFTSNFLCNTADC